MKNQYLLILIFILVVFVIVFLATYKNKVNTNPNNKEIIELSEQECKDSGYDWVHKSGLCLDKDKFDCGYRCDIKTNDYNKGCYSNDECEGNCFWRGKQKDSEGFLVGNCTEYKYSTDLMGGCTGVLKEKLKELSIVCP